jgi:hypothetical protein
MDRAGVGKIHENIALTIPLESSEKRFSSWPCGSDSSARTASRQFALRQWKGS